MTDGPFYSLSGPLDVLPAARQMRAANFSGFAELVRNLGGEPVGILERHGLDARAISDSDQCIDCSVMAEVFEYCSTALDDPLFGLRLAQMQDPDVFGCVFALCRNAPTFAESMRNFIEYIPIIHSPNSLIELKEAEETAEFRFTSRLGGSDNESYQAQYESVLLILKYFRQIGGTSFRPNYVRLGVSTRPKQVSEIENVIECPLYINTNGSKVSTIAFQKNVMQQPIANASRHVYRLLSSYLERIKAATRTSIIERVEDYVYGALPSGNCSIVRCAKRLGLSTRTLQAHLSDHGVQFSEILEQQRVNLAKAYLAHHDVSLDEVAFRLGYAEQSSFGPSFSDARRRQAPTRNVPTIAPCCGNPTSLRLQGAERIVNGIAAPVETSRRARANAGAHLRYRERQNVGHPHI
jgi:AraC-like DNA-binding protein